MKYKKGTQEMLDAAKDDATLLPFDTVFLTNKTQYADDYMPDGVYCTRTTEGFNTESSVAFYTVESNELFHACASDLIPAKKYKPKKWQNGTQAQLDEAKYDARLIPKKTYFAASSCAWVPFCHFLGLDFFEGRRSSRSM